MRLRRPFVIALLALLSLAALPPLEPPAQASPRASGHITANEVRHNAPVEHGRLERVDGGSGGAGAGQTGGDTAVLTSEVVDALQRFDFVGVHWQGPDTLPVDLRTSPDGRAWSEWATLREEEDMADLSAGEHYAAPHFAGDARYAQYRLYFTAGDPGVARSVALTFMDVSDLNASPLSRVLNDLEGAWRDLERSWTARAALATIPIRARQDWRADESLMQWTPQYVPWKKAIIHHTVTSNAYLDATAEIRSIYYYQAVTRGWGDIGYNFLVDRQGIIWTGRQGGDDVAGGHAYGWNDGTFGVAALGDFSVTGPGAPMLSALAHVVAMKFAQRGIQPLGADTFTHKEEDRAGSWVLVTTSPPNVLGHRDCAYVLGVAGGQTSCPGGSLYAQLATIRNLAQQAVTNGYTYLLTYATTLPRVANVGGALPVAVKITNTGRTTISAGSARLSYRILDATTGAVLVSQGPLVPLLGDIAVGNTQTLSATVALPATAGRYLVRWDLFVPQLGTWYSTLYNAPFRDQWLAVIEWDTTWISDTAPSQMGVGQSVPVTVTVKNTGGRTWPAQYVKLGYHWVSDVTGRVVVWNGNRGKLPFDVAPSQQVTVPITLTAPTYPTRYRLQFDLVWEGQFWFGDKGVDPLEKTVNIPFDFRATYAVPASLVLAPGLKTTVPVTVTNTGSSSWQAGGVPVVDLGTHWYQSGALVQWDGARTPLTGNVGPGQSVALAAVVEAPAAHGMYELRFDLALEGISWFSGKGVRPGITSVTVKTPTYGARYQPSDVGAIATAVQTRVPIVLTNTGDFPWSSPAFALAYHAYDARGGLALWDGARTYLPTVVQPGQSVTLQAKLELPSVPVTYTVKWDMVQEGVTWFSDKGVAPASQSVAVGTQTYGAAYNATLTPTAMATRMITTVAVSVTNASSFAFSPATNVFLAYHWYDPSGNVVVWDGKRGALNVVAGQTGTVWVEVIGPDAPGAYRLVFDLVQEGVTWFSGKGVGGASRGVSVVVPEYGGVYSTPAPQAGAPGQAVSVPLTVTNSGTQVWSNGEVFLSYHLYRDGGLVLWDGVRTALPAASLAPGQSATVSASVRLPASPGAYGIRFDLVQEGVTWFSGQGVPMSPLVTFTAQ